MLPSCTIVLFGATGNLAQKKLFPAFLALERKGALHPETRIIAIGRKEYTDESFRKEYGKLLGQKDSAWKRFTARISYQRLEFHDPGAYDALKEKAQRCPMNRVFYLATPQDAFPLIITHLSRTGLAQRNPQGAWHKVVFEKPFGSDLSSARALNKEIMRLFTEDQVYRIDHYLGKSFVQQILMLRFSNPMLEFNWSGEFIDNVQIVVAETEGVGTRSQYYDNAGVIRDMVQNHLLQLLALTAMEPPKSIAAEDIRNAKTRVLKDIRRENKWALQRNIVSGQYAQGVIEKVPNAGYRKEVGVRADSRTETFAAMKLEVRNRRWKGVPFYLLTGKALGGHVAKIAITFKSGSWLSFPNKDGKTDANVLVIRIQPDEGLQIRLNLAEETGKTIVEPHVIDFSHEAETGVNTPEAYELLISEVIVGDHTLFTRWDFVEESWKITDNLRRALHDPVPYAAGSNGPLEAQHLLERDGRSWVRLSETKNAHTKRKK